MNRSSFKVGMLLIFSVLLLLDCAVAQAGPSRARRLLYFTLSAGYQHASIGLSKAIVQNLGDEGNAYDVTISNDLSQLTEKNLERYDAVMFFTFGDIPMSTEQKQALLGFVQSGHGFVGIHSTIKTLQEWNAFGQMLGCKFEGKSIDQDLTIDVTDPSSKIVGFLDGPLKLKDEIYEVSVEPGDDVLLRLDSKESGSDTGNWPVAWTRSYGRGRVFVTTLGHESGVWTSSQFQHILQNSINWAMGGGE